MDTSNIVQQIYDFILFFINVIKDLVASVSGKKEPEIPSVED